MTDCKKTRGTRIAMTIVALCLCACDTRLPPAAPSRPHTSNDRYGVDMRKAVFRYDLPCVKTAHPPAPSVARGCEWQAGNNPNHGQVALSN